MLHQLLTALRTCHCLWVDLSATEAIDWAGAEILETVRRQAEMTGVELQLTGIPDGLLPLLPHFDYDDGLAAEALEPGA